MNCKFCQKAAAQYSCPRCNSAYCSLACYQGPSHLQCSETFYKECVENEMATAKSPSDRESLKKMYDTLLRMKNEDEGGDDDLDSDDDVDLADRLEGIDLDDADEVWKRLTPDERKEFENMCSSGTISELVPKYVPWWEESQSPVNLIQEVTNDAQENKTEASNQPKVDPNKIVPMKSLLGDKEPSPLVKFSVLNVIYAYAYAMRYFNGLDEAKLVPDFVAICLAVSANLRESQNFDSADMAVESAASAANQNPDISLGADVCRSVKKDVFQIVRGPTGIGQPKNAFLISALSHLKDILDIFQKERKKNQKRGKEKNAADKAEVAFSPKMELAFGSSSSFDKFELSKVKIASKKLDFYLSWAREYYKEYELFYGQK